MLIPFILMLLVAVFSLSVILKKQLPQSSYLLTDAASLWSIATLVSVIFTVATFLNANFFIFIGLFAILTAGLILLARNGYAERIASSRQFFARSSFIAPILLFVGIIVFSLIFLDTSERWGTWDAWTIWNLHAKFMVNSIHFQQMYLEPVYTGQDYPLMLPSLIALFWKLSGATSPMIPIIVSFIITLSATLVAYTALAQKSKALAVVLLAMMVGNVLFIQQGAYQYADTLLGLYLLLAVVCMYQCEGSRSPMLFVLMGILAASCGWVKNEGLLIFIIISLTFAVRNIRSFTNILLYAAGAVLPLAMAMYYKFAMAPSNDFLSQLNAGNITGHLLDFGRYYTILEYFVLNIFVEHHLPLLVLLAAIFVFRAFRPSYPGAIIIIASICYFLVYVVTQTDLMWNLGTSATRLFQHLFPAMLYVLFLGIAKSQHPWMAKLDKVNSWL